MGSGSAWDPAQYQRFGEQRRQPFDDLLGLVEPVPGGRVADLGCGTGELTVVLHRRVGAGHTVGVDRSESMLARAQGLVAPGVSFVLGDIACFGGPGFGGPGFGGPGFGGPGFGGGGFGGGGFGGPGFGGGGFGGGGFGGPGFGGPAERFDLIFANASFQWVPNHLAVLGRLVRLLVPGGQLAFQVPANGDHASHLIGRHVAAEEPFRSALSALSALDGGLGPGQDPIPPPERYAVVLHDWGFVRQSVRLQVYAHVLDSTSEVVEWVKGTLLTGYRERLSADLYAAFLDRYRERLHDAEGDQRPYLYPFKRILCWGRTGG